MTYAPPSTEARPRITLSSHVVHMCAHMLAHTREQQSSLSRTDSHYHGTHMTWPCPGHVGATDDVLAAVH